MHKIRIGTFTSKQSFKQALKQDRDPSSSLYFPYISLLTKRIGTPCKGMKKDRNTLESLKTKDRVSLKRAFKQRIGAP